MRLVLCRTPPGAYVSTLPPDRDLASWHKALAAEIAATLSPAHAAILAAPETGSVGIEWIANGERALACSALPPAGRDGLLSALGSMLSDIDRLAAGGEAPAVAAAWPALRRLPDESFVYAVDGRPVLAAWGHAPAAAASWPDPLAAIMPAPLALPNPAVRARAPVPVIAALLAVAFIIGLALPGVILRPFTCAVPAAAATALNQGNEAILHNADLTRQLDQMDEQAALKQSQCKPPNRALPEDQWDAGNLGMLKGCWHLTTNVTLYDTVTNQPYPIATWVICFDDHGIGQQTVTYQSSENCEGPVRASFDANHQMVIAEPTECSGSRSVVIGHWNCNRTSDSQASCVRTDDDGTSQGTFQR